MNPEQNEKAMNYKTPGVYVEEISLLPPSVAQVATAIPAFIGYTEKGPDEPVKITSMLQYREIFGGPAYQNFQITLDNNPPYLPQSAAPAGGESPYLMYPALQMFFDNGGAVCYVVSVGDFDPDSELPSLDNISDYSELKAGLDKAKKVDEVTLLVIPEAVKLMPNEQYDLYKDILAQCADLMNRFGIFDVRSDDDDAANFRNGIGSSFLNYGAAYTPHLKTALNYSYRDSGITFSHSASNGFNNLTLGNVKTLAEILDLQSQLTEAVEQIKEAETAGLAGVKAVKLRQINVSLSQVERAVRLVQNALEFIDDDSFDTSDFDSANTVFDTHNEAIYDTSTSNSDLDNVLTELSGAADDLVSALDDIVPEINSQTGINETRNENIHTYFTNEFAATLTELLNKKRLTLPPSTAMAGIFAKVDADRGVWKAPANVSINRVSAPSRKITVLENNDLNVHTSGKSINVIRSFTGRGTLVWGARTLDGNSNEWRYIPVRRFFIMVEESVKKATEPFVFEPNSAPTWVKVKAMIENFLTLQWRAGALMGGKPAEAFFVKVGLGETMTQDDVLNGKMIVEIGMAVVRPAEFIILRFSHKMLES